MKTLLSAVVGATLALCAVHAQAATPGDRQVALAINSKTLADALDQWAQQTGYQILVPDWDMAQKFTAPQLRGKFSARGALEQLLAGSPLTFDWLSDNLVTIREAQDTSSPTSWQTVDGSVRQLASEPVSKFVGDGFGGYAVAAAGERAVRASDDSRLSEAQGPTKVDPVEEVVVTGTHIRGVENNTVPVTVLDKTYIESTGISTTTRLLETLPQNFAFNSQSAVPGVPGASDAITQASSVTLRGLGEGTTLILLNGRRMAPGFRSSAVDISAIPLSAVERVEILTDGASAIYGSDAVGGVVNFVLRDDFQGAETKLLSGWADGSKEYRVSQLVGGSWDSGNALASLEYYDRDMLWATDRDFVPSTSLIGSLLPEDKSYSALLTGKQEFTPSLRWFFDGLYTNRDSHNFGGRRTLGQHTLVDNPQITGATGVTWDVAGDWQVELGGIYAKNKMEQTQYLRVGAVDQTSLWNSEFDVKGGQVKADGSLFVAPGGAVRAAIGAEWREETFEELGVRTATSAIVSDRASSQIVRSAFAEIYVPFVGAANSLPGVRRLELSLAGRFDDYSNFGSSFDPQIGAMWEPLNGLRVRASHGTSYKAPNLFDYSYASNIGIASFSADPASPGGTSYQFQMLGTDVAHLDAQESESTAIGLELRPVRSPSLILGLNYYRISYEDRIAAPVFTPTFLINPAFSDVLYFRDPSVNLVNEYIGLAQQGRGFSAFNRNFTPNTAFTPDSIDVIVDLRKRNLSLIETSGLDVSVRYGFDSELGDFDLGLAATHVDERVERVVSTGPEVETVDTIYNPTSWRARGSASWRFQGWAASLFVNYTDSYVDNRIAAAPLEVSSYTTVDAHVAYDLGARFDRGFLSGVELSVNAQNLLDRDPPHTAIVSTVSDMGFDPTNASPLGRLISVQIRKAW